MGDHLVSPRGAAAVPPEVRAACDLLGQTIGTAGPAKEGRRRCSTGSG